MNALEDKVLIHVYQIPVGLYDYVRKTRVILKWEFCDSSEEYCYVYVDAIQGRECDDWEDYFKLTSDTSATRENYLKKHSEFWIQNVPASIIFNDDGVATAENGITRVVITDSDDDDDDDIVFNVDNGRIVINE